MNRFTKIDEEKAIGELSAKLRIPAEEIERATQYEALKGGHTMFFKTGSGMVYETVPGEHFINSYQADFLDESLKLRQYVGRTMYEEEVSAFISSLGENSCFQSANGLLQESLDVLMCVLKALDYSEDWICEMLLPRVKEACTMQTASAS